MRSAGIIAEFNPLHNGHEYIINETRRLTDCESVIVAMSGNYVQRGEPALVDKWTRAETALRAGADLVVEIPTLFCLGNAAQYAKAGVSLLEALNKYIYICCGSESGDGEGLNYLSGFIQDNRQEIDGIINSLIKEGLSYPAAREEAIVSVMKSQDAPPKDIKKIRSLLNNPNDILAAEYLMASESSELFFVERMGSGYDDEFSSDAGYQSAKGIRELIYDKGLDAALDMLDAYVPEHTIDLLSKSELSFAEGYADLLRYAAIRMTADEIDDCPSGGEGLGHLIKEAVLKHDSWEDIIKHCKSKRYTYTRLSRLCMQIVLGINRSEYGYDEPEYIRVLGCSERGRKLLSHIKKKEEAAVPIITNINKSKDELSPDALKMLGLDVKASDVYNLVLGRDSVKYSDHRMKPIII